jgi:hypothetical protein
MSTELTASPDTRLTIEPGSNRHRRRRPTRCGDVDQTQALVYLLRDRIRGVDDMRMNARRAGHDRRDRQDHAGHSAKNTHGVDKGKRDARMIPLEMGALRDLAAMTVLHFRVTPPNSARRLVRQACAGCESLRACPRKATELSQPTSDILWST